MGFNYIHLVIMSMLTLHVKCTITIVIILSLLSLLLLYYN